MELDGGTADHQPLGDLGVAQPLDHQGQHLPLPLGQVVAGFGRLGGGLDQRLRRFWSQRGPASMGRPDGIGQFVGRDVLQQVADSACLQGSLHQFLLLEAGQGDDLDLRAALPDGAGGRGAVHPGHHQVHQHHVGLDLFAQAHGLLAAVGFCDQFQVIEGQQKSPQPAAYHGVVVHKHNANRI